MYGLGIAMAYNNLDNKIIKQFQYFKEIKIAISVLLIIICVALIMNLLRIRTIFMGKAINNELKNIKEIRQRDKYITSVNLWLRRLNIFNKIGFGLNSQTKEYLTYNIKRAGLKAVGGFRYITPEEYNSIIKLLEFTGIGLGLIVILISNMSLGFIVIGFSIVVFNTMPMLIIRQIVASKDQEIKKEFPKLYLRLHYELMAGGKTPVERTLRTYLKITQSEEMTRFVDDCLNTIDTYGEHGATAIISDDYREIMEVTRLMRLIRQSLDGADIQQELMGFREQLLKEEAYQIDLYKRKLVEKARRSMILLMIILVQAIISAMIIYLPDLGIGI